jgi:hypothetical protein
VKSVGSIASVTDRSDSAPTSPISSTRHTHGTFENAPLSARVPAILLPLYAHCACSTGSPVSLARSGASDLSARNAFNGPSSPLAPGTPSQVSRTPLQSPRTLLHTPQPTAPFKVHALLHVMPSVVCSLRTYYFVSAGIVHLRALHIFGPILSTHFHVLRTCMEL